MIRRLTAVALDYTSPVVHGAALWLFAVTGWPQLVMFFRDTHETTEPEIFA